MNQTQQYEVTFHYRDERNMLVKGCDVVTATSVNNAIAQVRARNSWRCKGMSCFCTRKL